METRQQQDANLAKTLTEAIFPLAGLRAAQSHPVKQAQVDLEAALALVAKRILDREELGRLGTEERLRKQTEASDGG